MCNLSASKNVKKTSSCLWSGAQRSVTMPLVTDRRTIRINVRPQAHQIIKRWSAGLRDGDVQMSEISVASRIYEWFGERPANSRHTKDLRAARKSAVFRGCALTW